MSHDPHNPISNETGEYIDISKRDDTPVKEEVTPEEPKPQPKFVRPRRK